VVQRYTNGESLRLLAKLYGISHEAVRQVLKKESDYRS
jgi:Mor family transcriptional regulator